LAVASTAVIVVSDALATFSFTMDLEQQDNDFTDESQYDVSVREFTTNNSDAICTTNNCTFELNNGEFRGNTFSAGYVLTGELVAERPSQTNEGETFSTINEIRVDLDRMSATESGGIRTEYLTGSTDVAGREYLILGNANFTENEATELKLVGVDMSPLSDTN
jgi:hypothetical protein